MSTSLPMALLILLLLLAAGGYAVATVGMKIASEGLSLFAMTLLALGFAAAVLAEIVLLRQADLPVVYIAIVVAETTLILIYSMMIGEMLNLRQMIGGGLVLAGFFMVTLAN
ncbi:MAG: 5-aminolevulinate synthase [Arenibacterium sp.]